MIKYGGRQESLEQHWTVDNGCEFDSHLGRLDYFHLLFPHSGNNINTL